MAYQYINLGYLDQMAAGDHSARLQLLQMLIVDLQAQLSLMRQLLHQQQWGRLRQACHHIKSTIPFTGNQAMAMANREIERQLTQAADASAISTLLGQMESLAPKVLQELRQEIELQRRS